MEKVIIELLLQEKPPITSETLVGERLPDAAATFCVYKSEMGFRGELLEEIDCEQYEMAVCITQLEWRYNIRRLSMANSAQYTWLFTYPEMLEIYNRLSGWNEFLRGK